MRRGEDARLQHWGGGGKLERRCERQMDAHLPYSAPPGDGVIPVQQLDNELSIIREVSGQTVKIKEMKTGGGIASLTATRLEREQAVCNLGSTPKKE